MGSHSAWGPKISAERATLPVKHALAFTVAPHLQPINHRGRFSPFVGI